MTMKAINLQMRINSVTHLAPRTRFLGSGAVVSTLAALLFTASGLMAAASASSVSAPALDEWVRQSPLPSRAQSDGGGLGELDSRLCFAAKRSR